MAPDRRPAGIGLDERVSQAEGDAGGLWAIPEAQRFHELIGGELIEKPAPSGEHGGAQAGVVGAIHGSFHRSPGRGGPGGWWIATEVEDPRDSTLTVMRWSADRYITRLRAERGEVVRAEPFEAVEIAVGTLFGGDPPA